jgi:hypothetical protein
VLAGEEDGALDPDCNLIAVDRCRFDVALGRIYPEDEPWNNKASSASSAELSSSSGRGSRWRLHSKYVSNVFQKCEYLSVLSSCIPVL